MADGINSAFKGLMILELFSADILKILKNQIA
jgi:hypothetical protein